MRTDENERKGERRKKKIRCEDVPKKKLKKRKGKRERERRDRKREKYFMNEMSVRVLYYLGIFSVSVFRLLDWGGPSLVGVDVRPKLLFPMSG